MELINETIISILLYMDQLSFEWFFFSNHDIDFVLICSKLKFLSEPKENEISNTKYISQKGKIMVL